MHLNSQNGISPEQYSSSLVRKTSAPTEYTHAPIITTAASNPTSNRVCFVEWFHVTIVKLRSIIFRATPCSHCYFFRFASWWGLSLFCVSVYSPVFRSSMIFRIDVNRVNSLLLYKSISIMLKLSLDLSYVFNTHFSSIGNIHTLL